jgi:hypothetical protein
MLTEDEARRMVEILKATVGQPIDQRIALIEQAIPRAPTIANIIMALHTSIELDNLELTEKNVELANLQKLLKALQRANALSGGRDMTIPEAEDYLKGLAQDGDREAEKLLEAFNTPFVE